MTPNRRARLVPLCVALITLTAILAPTAPSAGTLMATMAIPAVCNGDIPIISFQFGAKDTITAAGRERSGRVEVSDLSVVKVIDSCSPRLFLAAVQGTIIPNVTIQVSGNPTKATITLTQAIVSSIQASGSQGNDLPTEVVTFNYATMTLSIGGNQAVIQNPLLFGF